MKKNRNSSIELLRIIAMLMIIGSHLCIHGIINADGQNYLYEIFKNGSILNKVWTSGLVLGNIGAGIFFVISGYYYKKERRIGCKIILDILFYSVLSVLFIIIFTHFSIGIWNGYNINCVKTIMRYLFSPISGNNWWFVTAYIILITFIAPIIDEKIANERICLYAIIVLLICSFLAGFLENPFYRLFQATAYFCIGRYIRNTNNSETKIIHSHKILLLLLFAFHIFLMFFKYEITNKTIYQLCDLLLVILISPLISGIIFMIFLEKEICNERINRISQNVFGVYLLHDSIPIRDLLWNSIIDVKKLYLNIYFPFISLFIIGAVFIVCLLINMFYDKFIKTRLIYSLNNFNNIKSLFKR